MGQQATSPGRVFENWSRNASYAQHDNDKRVMTIKTLRRDTTSLFCAHTIYGVCDRTHPAGVEFLYSCSKRESFLYKHTLPKRLRSGYCDHMTVTLFRVSSGIRSTKGKIGSTRIYLTESAEQICKSASQSACLRYAAPYFDILQPLPGLASASSSIRSSTRTSVFDVSFVNFRVGRFHVDRKIGRPSTRCFAFASTVRSLKWVMSQKMLWRELCAPGGVCALNAFTSAQLFGH